jgi:hypothetical protein
MLYNLGIIDMLENGQGSKPGSAADKEVTSDKDSGEVLETLDYGRRELWEYIKACAAKNAIDTLLLDVVDGVAKLQNYVSLSSKGLDIVGKLFPGFDPNQYFKKDYADTYLRCSAAGKFCYKVKEQTKWIHGRTQRSAELCSVLRTYLEDLNEHVQQISSHPTTITHLARPRRFYYAALDLFKSQDKSNLVVET